MQNYTQRLEMQIPQETTYTGLIISKNKDNFDEILKSHYDINLEKLNEINDYITNDLQLKN